MATLEFRILARVEQFAAPQREAAVADIVSIAELRPSRSDIIILKEAWIPLQGIDYEPIPLNDKAVFSVDVMDQPAKHEFGVSFRRPQPLDRYYADPWIDRRNVTVSEEKALREFGLV
jgi:hypothetical protein